MIAELYRNKKRIGTLKDFDSNLLEEIARSNLSIDNIIIYRLSYCTKCGTVTKHLDDNTCTQCSN